MNQQDLVLQIILQSYPDVQAIYLFGSYGTKDQWPDSDVDLGLLLPPAQSKSVTFSTLHSCQIDLAELLLKDVDLINMRQVSTVFKKEIISTGRIIYSTNQYAVDEFEMLTISYYQKLNQERLELLVDFKLTGRAYKV
jgi:predicted nucleotidyltransferase